MTAPPLEGKLDHERLDVYQAALQFLPLALSLLPRQGERSLLDQLERAGQSVILNIAEGAGRRSRQEKRHFYEIARGSATECASILDILRVRRIGSPETNARARLLLIRIVQMLSRLSGAAQPGRRVSSRR
jgi:four helix bundle protein